MTADGEPSAPGSDGGDPDAADAVEYAVSDGGLSIEIRGGDE